MTAATTAKCIGEPVSWLRLEQHALAADLEVARHLEECAACRACLAGIESDRGRALPPLGEVAIAAAARRRRLQRARWLGAGTALVAAAAAVLLLLPGRDDRNMPGIKGGDDLVLDLVRERAGEVVATPSSYRDGDRFKVLVTCARPGELAVDVTVEQAGEIFTPLPRAAIRCGNRVALPGAFSLSGAAPARVCARLAATTSCTTLQPAEKN